ncbi:MAG: SPFH domain-containing protein [Candidatus Paceibacterota bacterium]
MKMPNMVLAEMSLSGVLVPVLIVGFFVGLLFIVWAMTKRYKRIPPNVIGVIYGKGRSVVTGPNGERSEIGFKLVSGGSVFIMPVFEEYREMSTEVFQIQISEDNIPSMKNVGVTVSGVATCRISPVPEEQMNAVQNFLGKPLETIKEMTGEILRGHLRSIVGALEVEELLRQRSKFNELVVKECSPELARMGIRILNLVIQDVKDKEGYIEALGKQAVAGAKRDAQIATAEAERETAVKTSDAKRTAAEVTAQNDAKIKEAEKNRDIQVATFKLETAGKQAEADMAGEIAKTSQEQKLVVLQAGRDSAAAEAQAKVMLLEGQRKEKELQATVIVTAEADAKALSIRATGKRNADQIEAENRKNVATLNAETAKQDAEGKKNALVLEGQGEASKLQTVAEAQAIATQKTKLAEAEGEKALLLAKASGEQASLLAQAEGSKAARLAEAEGKLKFLLAEAEGTDKMAEALKKMNNQAQLILILDRLPGLLTAGGDAGEKIAAAIFGNLGKSLEKIGPITITDLGGGNTAKDGVAAIGDIMPNIVASFFAKAKLLGVDMTPLYTLLKMDPAKLAAMVAPFVPPETASSTAVVAETASPAVRS